MIAFAARAARDAGCRRRCRSRRRSSRRWRAASTRSRSGSRTGGSRQELGVRARLSRLPRRAARRSSPPAAEGRAATAGGKSAGGSLAALAIAAGIGQGLCKVARIGPGPGRRGRWDVGQAPARGSLPCWRWRSALGAGRPIAPAQDGRPRPSLNLYGVTGLIDMPSAESQPDGQIIAELQPVRRDARGATSPSRSCRGCRARCATRRSRTAGQGRRPGLRPLRPQLRPAASSCCKERGGWQPSLALGLRDFLGTGVYSAEYLVATQDRGAGLHR